MAERVTALDVRAVHVTDPEVLALVDALTVELADQGYTDEESFGYSPDQLAAAGVHLVGARLDGALVGIGGIELQDAGVAELKRFYVAPAHRGRGAADAIVTALVRYAAAHGVRVLRLETGDEQQAAMSFYRRHGFTEVERFGPYADSATSICMSRDVVR